MSSEIIYKVKVLRAGPANNIVRGLVLACSSNCFPKPRRHEEPDSELFAIDLAQPDGSTLLKQRIESLCRGADGGCIKENYHHYTGPAYYRLWCRRLRKVGIELPAPDLAAVRYDHVAEPEKRLPKIAFNAYRGRIVEFTPACLRHRGTGELVYELILLGRDPTQPDKAVTDLYGEGGRFLGCLPFKWSRLYRLLRQCKHVVSEIIPAAFSGPMLLRAGSSTPEPISFPTETKARLAALQEAVGGYIEVVYGKDGREIYVNEDGISLALPRNDLATREARAVEAVFPFDTIKGNCVIIPASAQAEATEEKAS